MSPQILQVMLQAALLGVVLLRLRPGVRACCPDPRTRLRLLLPICLSLLVVEVLAPCPSSLDVLLLSPHRVPQGRASGLASFRAPGLTSLGLLKAEVCAPCPS